MTDSGEEHGQEDGDDQHGGGGAVAGADTGGAAQFVAQRTQGARCLAYGDGGRERGPPLRGRCPDPGRIVTAERVTVGGRVGRSSHVADLVGELVDEDAVPEGGLADVGAGAAVHREPVAVLAHDLDGALAGPGLLGDQGAETVGVRAADGHPGAQPGAGEVRGLLVGGEAALPQRDDAVGHPSGFLGVARAEQDGAALGRVRTQDPVHPAAFTGGESGGGVVEDEGVRVGQQGAGKAQAAVQTARERAQALVAQADETGHFEDLVGAPYRNPGRGAQHAELSVDGARGMAGHIAEKYADLVRRMGDPVQLVRPRK